MKKAAVIVDTRNNIELVATIKKHMEMLDDSWSLYIFCSIGNSKMFDEHFPTGVNVLPILENMDIEAYNKLLTSEYFWNFFPQDKILIFQHDSMLLRKGIDEFLAYDYVGAPWTWQHKGGNGGLSLRSKQTMLDIIKKVPYNNSVHGNEDGYFCNHMDVVNGFMAPREVCAKFSVEAVYELGSLGFHAIDKWLSEEECFNIVNQYK